MKVEIKHRYLGNVLFSIECGSLKIAVEAAVNSGADLRGADLRDADLHSADLYGANLHSSDLRGADLRDADLRGAYLHSANLHRADLRGADLRGADLRGAYLHSANLHSSDLRGAENINKNRVTPLLILLDQPGEIRAYKLVTKDGIGPFNGGITYVVGKSYSVENADTSDTQCAPGINLATLDWCMQEWKEGYRILVVEFTAKDIASIPIATNGKFRVHRCKIVGEKNLVEIGLVPAKKDKEA